MMQDTCSGGYVVQANRCAGMLLRAQLLPRPVACWKDAYLYECGFVVIAQVEECTVLVLWSATWCRACCLQLVVHHGALRLQGRLSLLETLLPFPRAARGMDVCDVCESLLRHCLVRDLFAGTGSRSSSVLGMADRIGSKLMMMVCRLGSVWTPL